MIDKNKLSQINAKIEAKHSDEATWLHRQYPEIEKELKARTAALLKGEIAKIEAWLSERVVG